jgi:hypothetical protein
VGAEASLTIDFVAARRRVLPDVGAAMETVRSNEREREREAGRGEPVHKRMG